VVNPVAPQEIAPRVFPYGLDGLVAAHSYLCRRAARKFRRPGLERSDLEQVAAVGLVKAARRFDPTIRTPFEAYAWITIVGELMHYVRDHERVVRVPRRLRSLETRFLQAHETLLGRLEREPNESEVASAMGVRATTVAELRGAREVARRITIEEANVSAFLDPGAISIEDRLLVQSAFAALPQLERRIIAGVYVLGLSQLELARRLGTSPKRISRLHRTALRSMHRSWAS
jgi:RNA polymerase sigma-B factor